MASAINGGPPPRQLTPNTCSVRRTWRPSADVRQQIKEEALIDQIVILGASGDLTSRLLMPAFAVLSGEGKLPSELHILGAGRADYTAETFRDRIADALATHAGYVDADARRQIVRALDYRQTDVSNADQLSSLIDGIDRPLLVYLALPPWLFEPTLTALGKAGLPAGSAVAVEKPFGNSLSSARALNELLQAALPTSVVYRVDHFLSNELAARVLVLRFANRLIEAAWTGHDIARVEITWNETLTLEGRAGYYDGAGALRDMLQNHLLMILAYVAMEEPARLDERSVRDARAAALRAVSIASPEESIRGRYSAGWIGKRRVPSYVDEPGVDPSRQTETFAQLTVRIPNARWENVPFILRSGKAFGRDQAEIAIHFRDAPGLVLRNRPTPNVLRIGLSEPYVRLSVNTNAPDHTLVDHPFIMESVPAGREAYANLMLEMLQHNPMLTVRDDEAEELWRIVEPVLSAWSAGKVPLREYPAGALGPNPFEGEDEDVEAPM